MKEEFKHPSHQHDSRLDYLATDWQAMEALLYLEMPQRQWWEAFLLFKRKINNNKPIISIIMFTTVLLSAGLLLFHVDGNKQSVHSSDLKKGNETGQLRSFTEEEVVLPHFIPPSEQMTSLVNSGSANPKPLESLSGLSTEGGTIEVIGPDSTVEEDLRFYRMVTRRYETPAYSKYVYSKPSGDIEGFWMGLHFAGQEMKNINEMNAIGQRIRTNGFSIQFMSGNVFRQQVHHASYMGFEWGMQFFKNSDRDTILINSKNLDRGLSHMTSNSHDFLLRWHYEYARFGVVPYINLGAGFRVFNTDQQLQALMVSTEYESSNQQNVLATGTWLTTVAAGAHVRLSPHVHLDMRYEWMPTGRTDVVNYGNTTFNGSTYQILRQKVDLSSGQFKIGLLFDFQDDEEIVEVPAEYQEEYIELLINEAESKIIIPCEIEPVIDFVPYEPNNGAYDNQDGNSGGYDANPENYESTDDSEEEEKPRRRWWQSLSNDNGGTGGSGGGSKSSFPGTITTPKSIKH